MGKMGHFPLTKIFALFQFAVCEVIKENQDRSHILFHQRTVNVKESKEGRLIQKGEC